LENFIEGLSSLIIRKDITTQQIEGFTRPSKIIQLYLIIPIPEKNNFKGKKH